MSCVYGPEEEPDIPVRPRGVSAVRGPYAGMPHVPQARGEENPSLLGTLVSCLLRFTKSHFTTKKVKRLSLLVINWMREMKKSPSPPWVSRTSQERNRREIFLITREQFEVFEQRHVVSNFSLAIVNLSLEVMVLHLKFRQLCIEKINLKTEFLSLRGQDAWQIARTDL